MATKYQVVLMDGTLVGAAKSRKNIAISLGEANEQPFQVVTDKGAVVHTSPEAEAPAQTTEADTTAPAEEKEAPVAATKKAPAKKAAAKKTAAKPQPQAEPEVVAEEREGTELEFEGLGKYYAKAAGLHGAEVVGAVYGVEASLKGSTLTLYGEDEDVEQVIDQLRALWPAAKLAHREYRKNDKVYSAISKDRKDHDANAQRWELEVAWFMAFMDGAADALSDNVKRKGGAYKDGVTAVQNPAPADEDADVI